MMPRWNRPPLAHQRRRDLGLASRSSGASRPHHFGQLQIAKSFKPNLQNACCTNNSSVDRRGSLRWKDFKKLRVPLPSLDEQQAISEVLDTIDREIELLVNQIASLRSEEILLMQQLLTGKRRVQMSKSENDVMA